MERVLFIPHGSDPNLKVRGYELAKALANRPDCDVYFLEHARNFSEHFFDKLIFFIHELFRRQSITAVHPQLHILRIPYLHSPLTAQSIHMIRQFADRQIVRLIERIQPTIVINESHFSITVPPSTSYQLIYDLVDDHLPGSIDGWFGTLVGQFTMKQLAHANQIWTISYTLIEKLAQLGYRNVRYVPNGTELVQFKDSNPLTINQLRQDLGMSNKYLIGYIGNHASWSGLDFLIDVARQAPPDWHFLIVGGGTEVERLMPKNNLSNLTFVGPVPRDHVSEYFLALDVGILPFVKNPLTDAALQLKIIEYGAAHKLTIAQPLAELERLQLPHVLFPKTRTPEAWIKTLTEARQTPWQSTWDTTIEHYDWQRIADAVTWR